jgi:hypothetical protein
MWAKKAGYWLRKNVSDLQKAKKSRINGEKPGVGCEEEWYGKTE